MKFGFHKQGTEPQAQAIQGSLEDRQRGYGGREGSSRSDGGRQRCTAHKSPSRGRTDSVGRGRYWWHD